MVSGLKDQQTQVLPWSCRDSSSLLLSFSLTSRPHPQTLYPYLPCLIHPIWFCFSHFQRCFNLLHVLGREIAINAFYVSLGCFALTGKEEARQEAAIPPTLVQALPSASATYHHGHSSGEYKKQNSQSLSASDHLPGFKYRITSVQHLQTKPHPCTEIHLRWDSSIIQRCITLLFWLKRQIFKRLLIKQLCPSFQLLLSATSLTPAQVLTWPLSRLLAKLTKRKRSKSEKGRVSCPFAKSFSKKR